MDRQTTGDQKSSLELSAQVVKNYRWTAFLENMMTFLNNP